MIQRLIFEKGVVSGCIPRDLTAFFSELKENRGIIHGCVICDFFLLRRRPCVRLCLDEDLEEIVDEHRE